MSDADVGDGAVVGDGADASTAAYPDAGRRPLVSAVIIFCNEQEHLTEAVDSVRAQTVNDWELILVDDGSTDASTIMARRWAAEEPERIRYVEHPDHRRRGMSASRNRGVEAATGRYVAYLDADDAWLPHKLERQLQLLAEHPEVRLVYGPLTRWYSWTGRPDDQGHDDLYGLDGHRFRLRPGTVLRPPRLSAVLLEHKDLVPSGALFERDLFLEVGGAEERFTDNYEDAVVFLKMGLRAPAYVADRAWYRYRQYPRPADRARRQASRPDAERLRGDAARAVFLDWAESHLRSQDRLDAELARALRRARRQIGAGRWSPGATLSSSIRAMARRAGPVVRAGRLGVRHGRLVVGGQLRRLPADHISDEFGFSLAAGGWEPLREALRSHDRNPSAPVEDTAFGRFLMAEVTNGVEDLNDLLDLSDRPLGLTDLPRFWLGTYPWGGIDPTEIGRPGPAFGWAHDRATGHDTSELWGRGRAMWYRPDDPFTIESEWQRTIALDQSVAGGYRPVRARGFPLVTILRHDDGRWRAVIVDGHHRLAVLAHRGARTVTVEVGAVIERVQAPEWYHVVNGHCTRDEAVRFFDAFFELDGSERFRRVAADWEPVRAR
jgi:glycosyltransferase involved in cell wall biosynthesis